MANKKPLCRYGDKCFRKNLNHLKNYEHSSEQLNDENSYHKDENESLNKSEKLDLLTKKSENCTEQNIPLKEIEKFDLSKISDMRKFVTETNRMEMPEDFYQFLEFCKTINESDPKYALKDIGIELTGIYDLVIRGYKLDYRLHARYFLDPPEFQTVLKVINSPSETHFGYFRDDPDELPSFVAVSEPKLDCKIHIKSDNLFGALNWYLDELLSGRSYKIGSSLEIVKNLKSSFDLWCEKLKSSKSFSLGLKTPRIKSRDKKMNAKTFHTSGLVVPVDSNGFGYREIPETYEKQKQLFKIFCDKNQEQKKHASDRIQEIITLIQFANDEIDYGMGLEFGLNMFCFGDVGLHKFVKIILPTAYELLGRSLYAEIITEHLKNRKVLN